MLWNAWSRTGVAGPLGVRHASTGAMYRADVLDPRPGDGPTNPGVEPHLALDWGPSGFPDASGRPSAGHPGPPAGAPALSGFTAAGSEPLQPEDADPLEPEDADPLEIEEWLRPQAVPVGDGASTGAPGAGWGTAVAYPSRRGQSGDPEQGERVGEDGDLHGRRRAEDGTGEQHARVGTGRRQVSSLRALRTALGLSQTEVGKRWGRPQTQVSRLEGEPGRAELPTLAGYARALGGTTRIEIVVGELTCVLELD